MSPEIRKGKHVVYVPDQSGIYETELGPLTVDSSMICPGKGQKTIMLEADWLRGTRYRNTRTGRRYIQLQKRDGAGSTQLKQGDGELVVQLDRPIGGMKGRYSKLGAYYPDYPELNIPGEKITDGKKE